MNSKMFIVVMLLLLILVGFILKRMELSKLIKRLNVTLEYNKTFVELMNDIFVEKRFDNEKYMWLTEKVNSMQRELGASGLIYHYTDPLKGFTAREYQLLINFLPEIRGYMRQFDNSIMIERFDTSARLCTDMFIRHEGDLKEIIEKEGKQLFNPFSCLAEAVRYVIAMPFNILYWFGILPEGMLYRIKYSWLLKFINAIIILIGFIGSIITIVLGWDGFLEFLKQYL